MTVALELPVVPAVAPAVPPVPARPVLRVVPAPPCAPPYDDDTRAAPLPRLLPTAALPARPTWDDSFWFTEDRTPAAELPPAEPLAHALVQGLVEVLAGARPLRLFRMHLDVELYAGLEARLHGGRRRAGVRPQRVVRSLHVQVRPEGVAEVCATMRLDDAYDAVALRLEGFGGRWVCTDLEGL
jgi:hypothetical protein